MSSSVKRAKVSIPHGVKTTDSGKRYVDIRDVIHSELSRIEKSKHGDVGRSRNDGNASRNGSKESDKT